MRINHKILNIPPHISTSWRNVTSLHIEHDGALTLLVIGLSNGTFIKIPDLGAPIIEAIFAAHGKFLEEEQDAQQTLLSSPLSGLQEGQTLSFSLPFKLGVGEGVEDMGALMQHNPQQADLPDLPPEMLAKIVAITKAIGIDPSAVIPPSEPHCNCMHCQLSKALHNEMGQETQTVEPKDEIVSDEDLKFRTWDIQQSADNLYIVTDPLNTAEHYNVFLGEPLGCTCGQKNCEHIRAVLQS